MLATANYKRMLGDLLGRELQETFGVDEILDVGGVATIRLDADLPSTYAIGDYLGVTIIQTNSTPAIDGGWQVKVTGRREVQLFAAFDGGATITVPGTTGTLRVHHRETKQPKRDHSAYINGGERIGLVQLPYDRHNILQVPSGSATPTLSMRRALPQFTDRELISEVEVEGCDALVGARTIDGSWMSKHVAAHTVAIASIATGNKSQVVTTATPHGYDLGDAFPVIIRGTDSTPPIDADYIGSERNLNTPVSGDILAAGGQGTYSMAYALSTTTFLVRNSINVTVVGGAAGTAKLTGRMQLDLASLGTLTGAGIAGKIMPRGLRSHVYYRDFIGRCSAYRQETNFADDGATTGYCVTYYRLGFDVRNGGYIDSLQMHAPRNGDLGTSINRWGLTELLSRGGGLTRGIQLMLVADISVPWKYVGPTSITGGVGTTTVALGTIHGYATGQRFWVELVGSQQKADGTSMDPTILGRHIATATSTTAFTIPVTSAGTVSGGLTVQAIIHRTQRVRAMQGGGAISQARTVLAGQDNAAHALTLFQHEEVPGGLCTSFAESIFQADPSETFGHYSPIFNISSIPVERDSTGSLFSNSFSAGANLVSPTAAKRGKPALYLGLRFDQEIHCNDYPNLHTARAESIRFVSKLHISNDLLIAPDGEFKFYAPIVNVRGISAAIYNSAVDAANQLYDRVALFRVPQASKGTNAEASTFHYPFVTSSEYEILDLGIHSATPNDGTGTLAACSKGQKVSIELTAPAPAAMELGVAPGIDGWDLGRYVYQAHLSGSGVAELDDRNYWARLIDATHIEIVMPEDSAGGDLSTLQVDWFWLAGGATQITSFEKAHTTEFELERTRVVAADGSLEDAALPSAFESAGTHERAVIMVGEGTSGTKRYPLVIVSDDHYFFPGSDPRRFHAILDVKSDNYSIRGRFLCESNGANSFLILERPLDINQRIASAAATGTATMEMCGRVTGVAFVKSAALPTAALCLYAQLAPAPGSTLPNEVGARQKVEDGLSAVHGANSYPYDLIPPEITTIEMFGDEDLARLGNTGDAPSYSYAAAVVRRAGGSVIKAGTIEAISHLMMGSAENQLHSYAVGAVAKRELIKKMRRHVVTLAWPYAFVATAADGGFHTARLGL